MSNICLTCGKPVPEGSRFCPECGAEVPSVCPNCGAPLTGSRFCPECGTRLVPEEPYDDSSTPVAVPFPSRTTEEANNRPEYQSVNRAGPSDPVSDRSPFDVESNAKEKAVAEKKKKPVYKKWWFWVLAALAALVILESVGGSEDEPVSVKPATTDKTEQTEKQDSSKETEKQDKNEDGTVIEETVLLDERDVVITAKSFNAGSDPQLKLLIENNSDQDLTFQVRNVSVNGYMMEPGFSADVAAGKKANDSITFYRSELRKCGIDTVADIEFNFYIFDTDTWEDDYSSDTIRLETSAAKDFEYVFDDSGELVYDGNGVIIKARELDDEDSFFGSSIMVYIENNSGRDITVQARDLSVNGFMVEPIFSCNVCSGKHAVSGITLMESDIEQNEIESIDSVELSFHIFDADSWNTIVDTEKVTIEF